MRVLALNAGSSSLKAAAFEIESAPRSGEVPRGRVWTAEARGDAGVLGELLAPVLRGSVDSAFPTAQPIDVIGHRIVHGGARLRDAVVITPLILEEILRASELAPAHNALALDVVRTTMALFGNDVPHIAVFDTAFHKTLEPAAYTYAGPFDWIAQGIRRFGFHGINHEYVSQRALVLSDRRTAGSRIVTCHLGSGCSLAAIHDGRSVDTTMGFTPLDGLPMAHRSGAIDPGILLHLLRTGSHTVATLDQLLQEQSGLAGLSGTTGDMRIVLDGMDAGDARCRLAFDVFVHHVRKGIAAMAASMAGLDVLVFTGGVGEHSPRVRSAICSSLDFLGITLCPDRNLDAAGESELSDATSGAGVFVIPAEENWMIAQASVRVAASSVREPEPDTFGAAW